MIRVRYTGSDLAPEGIEETLDGDRYEIMDDNTVVLLAKGGKRVGHLHRDRWMSVSIVEDVKA